MVECGNMTRDPFVITGEMNLDRQVLRSILGDPPIAKDVESNPPADENRNQSGSQQKSIASQGSGNNMKRDPATAKNVESITQPDENRKKLGSQPKSIASEGSGNNNNPMLESVLEALGQLKSILEALEPEVDQTEKLEQINTVVRKNVNDALKGGKIIRYHIYMEKGGFGRRPHTVQQPAELLARSTSYRH